MGSSRRLLISLSELRISTSLSHVRQVATMGEIGYDLVGVLSFSANKNYYVGIGGKKERLQSLVPLGNQLICLLGW